ncbi:hypothetical protein N7516_009408 [Penicillium verrucosum]|uniref:uncharacterized protein n=1 Tax=Penicillium verrucosum TaxID=60171 RepID=UPI0025451442|nr:uncharacterized protein N7516_009408 [Penicillium verrucosum]KAJ5927635.1 hypothetical protein N7516_009408 [Penicillium verrucosum]
MNNPYDHALREQWQSSLMGEQFWDDVTRHAQERAANENEEQALTGQLPHQNPTQSSSKGLVQTTVTSSTEKSPQKKKSRFELPRLASFNSVRLRNTINPAPVRTHTATSPEKSLEKGHESSKREDRPLPTWTLHPPSGPENSYHFPTIPQTIISSEEWVESDPHPEPVPTPRPSRSAQINLMAYLNEGGTWANIPRTESVLELNMLCDARKGSPNSHVEFDHDQTGAVSDVAIQANVPGRGEEIEVRITIPSDHALRPLVEFRNLRVLRLTGMFKSYQRTIWQAVWLNPQLVTLELEMAVGLEIKEPVPRGWKPIRDGWVMNAGSFGAPVYYGEGGTGEISSRLGYGEYLDKFCIEKARLLAGVTGFPVPRYLPVKHLTLTGFAVDGDAFGMWFRNLEEVHFKKDCVDCGFWLSRAQRGVRVRHSNKLGEGELAELTAAVGGLRTSGM